MTIVGCIFQYIHRSSIYKLMRIRARNVIGKATQRVQVIRAQNGSEASSGPFFVVFHFALHLVFSFSEYSSNNPNRKSSSAGSRKVSSYGPMLLRLHERLWLSIIHTIDYLRVWQAFYKKNNCLRVFKLCQSLAPIPKTPFCITLNPEVVTLLKNNNNLRA